MSLEMGFTFFGGTFASTVNHIRVVSEYTYKEQIWNQVRYDFHFLRFPTLDEIFHFKFCPLEPIYVVNCNRPRKSIIEEKIEENLSSVQGEISFSLLSVSSVLSDCGRNISIQIAATVVCGMLVGKKSSHRMKSEI